MAKAKTSKTTKLNSSSKRNLFIIAIVLLGIGLLIFVMENKKQKALEKTQINNEAVEGRVTADIGPNVGCELKETNYVCSIGIRNPSNKFIEWSATVEELGGASLSNNGGTIAAKESTVIQLTVSKAFCDETPDGEISVRIQDNARESIKAETEFDCEQEIENTDIDD